MKTQIQVKAVSRTVPYQTDIQTEHHLLLADEPEEDGGTNAGPTPSQLLCAALSSCIAITLNMYASRKSWDTGRIEVRVSLDRSKEVPAFEVTLQFGNTLLPEQTERLKLIAGKCPVHKLLMQEKSFNISV